MKLHDTHIDNAAKFYAIFKGDSTLHSFDLYTRHVSLSIISAFGEIYKPTELSKGYALILDDYTIDFMDSTIRIIALPYKLAAACKDVANKIDAYFHEKNKEQS